MKRLYYNCYRAVYKLFNPTLLSFILGLTSSMALTIYSASEENQGSKNAMLCFAGASVLSIILSFIHASVEANLSTRIDSNSNLPPDKPKEAYSSIEKLAMTDVPWHQYCFPILAGTLIFTTGMGIMNYQTGKENQKKQSDRSAEKLDKKLEQVLSREDSLLKSIQILEKKLDQNNKAILPVKRK